MCYLSRGHKTQSPTFYITRENQNNRISPTKVRFSDDHLLMSSNSKFYKDPSKLCIALTRERDQVYKLYVSHSSLRMRHRTDSVEGGAMYHMYNTSYDERMTSFPQPPFTVQAKTSSIDSASPRGTRGTHFYSQSYLSIIGALREGMKRSPAVQHAE